MNEVEMKIPDSNPLFDWVMKQRVNEAIPYVNLSVAGIEVRLVLVSAPGIHWSSSPDEETYLTTEWRLLRSRP